MSSRREGLEFILARVLTKVWMIPSAILLPLLPKVENTRFHSGRSRDQQTLTLAYFPVMIICILIVKDYAFIHNGRMKLGPLISKIFSHQLGMSLDVRDIFSKNRSLESVSSSNLISSVALWLDTTGIPQSIVPSLPRMSNSTFSDTCFPSWKVVVGSLRNACWGVLLHEGSGFGGGVVNVDGRGS
jgi:hypothetical protein